MNEINTRISQIGVVPVIKLNNPNRDAKPLADALCKGGIPVAEVTFRAEGADRAIKLMKEARPEIIAGAGTVLTTEQVDKAIDAGAQFIVTPGFDPEIVKYCVDKNIPIYPGCTTPTDYHAAYKFGLPVVKFLHHSLCLRLCLLVAFLLKILKNIFLVRLSVLAVVLIW